MKNFDFSDNRLHLGALVGLALAAGALNHMDPAQQQSRASQAQAQEQSRLSRTAQQEEVRQRRALSKLAIQRAELGCSPMVLREKPWISPNLVEGNQAFDEDNVLLVNGVICTINSTAETDENGLIKNVINVAPEDLEEYTPIFKKLLEQRQQRFNEITPTY